MVAHVVDRRRRDEAGRHEVGHGGLAVERVAAGEADDAGVARHPCVGGVGVLGVYEGRWDVEVL